MKTLNVHLRTLTNKLNKQREETDIYEEELNLKASKIAQLNEYIDSEQLANSSIQLDLHNKLEESSQNLIDITGQLESITSTLNTSTDDNKKLSGENNTLIDENFKLTEENCTLSR